MRQMTQVDWMAIAVNHGINVNFIDEPLTGFTGDGWAVWLPLSQNEFLESVKSWTPYRWEAAVFGDLSYAVSAAMTWSYFAASSSIQVIRVSRNYMDGEVL